MSIRNFEFVDLDKKIPLESIDYQARRYSALGAIKIKREDTFITIKQHLLDSDEPIKRPSELVDIAKHFYERNAEGIAFTYKALSPFIDKTKITRGWIKEKAKRLKIDSRYLASLICTSKASIEMALDDRVNLTNAQKLSLFHALKSMNEIKKIQSELRKAKEEIEQLKQRLFISK